MKSTPSHSRIRPLNTPQHGSRSHKLLTTTTHKPINQFEDADPTCKDRKIIRIRNVVDLGDGEDGRKTAHQRLRDDEFEDNYLEQLDQWVENLQSKKKAFAFEQMKPVDNKQNLELEFNTDNGPTINQAILNQIMKPNEKLQIIQNEEEEPQEQVQVKFQMLRNKDNSNIYKTLDQVRIEMNKKILNSLLLQKVTKKLDEMQINRKHKSAWNIQRLDEECATVFREQTQMLKSKTLNNFKGLTEYFSNPAQYIDYDIVLTKAKHHSNRPPASFPNTLIPQSQQTSQSAKSLMDSYHQFHLQIKEHKQILFQMRIDSNQLVQSVQKKEEDLGDVRRKYHYKEEKARSGWLPDQSQHQEGTMKKRNLMEIIEKIRHSKEQEIKVIQREIVSIKQLISQNNEKQSVIQKELDELRQKKKRCKLLLKDIFLKQISEANFQLVPEGLVSIIKNMRKINENAKPEHFPKFFDEESKYFLIKAAQLELSIEEIRAMQQKNQQQVSQKNSGKQPQLGHTNFVSVMSLKNQVKQMMKRNKVSIKKPVFVQGIDPLNPSQFAHVIKWENQDLESQQIMEVAEPSFKLQSVPSDGNISTKDYNQRLVALQQELEQLQQDEVDRILKSYQNKKHLSDVQELKMVLYCLFGQSQGDQLWYQFVQEWTEQKSLNPQQILKQETEGKDITHGDKHKTRQSKQDTLASVPVEMKAKINRTFKNLTQISNVDYNYNLLQ